MSPPFTRGSTRTALTPLAIPRSSLSPSTNPWGRILGVATVDILSPAGFFQPVLPVRSGNKLPFLCVAPVSRRSGPNPCCIALTTAITRTWIGCYAVLGAPELVKAVEKGYTIVKIHEVWRFPEDQRQTGLFADYVNTWLKLKQETVGWPSWCQTAEKKREYILRYREREGIRLDISQVAKNPGSKAKAKLMLNRYLFHFFFFMLSSHSFSWLLFCSFWGTFGERINKPTTVTVKDPSHLFSLVSDAAIDISTFRLCTDNILEAVYTSVHDNAVKGTKTNIFVAAFTTYHARLKLYGSLDTLQEQVLYYDTDSVVYKWRPDQPSIATGDFLADMTDELDGDIITEFVSVGRQELWVHDTAG